MRTGREEEQRGRKRNRGNIEDMRKRRGSRRGRGGGRRKWKGEGRETGLQGGEGKGEDWGAPWPWTGCGFPTCISSLATSEGDGCVYLSGRGRVCACVRVCVETATPPPPLERRE